jgi:biotin carboxylase
VEAARRIGAALTVASEQASTFDAQNPAGLITLDFANPQDAAAEAYTFSRKYPIDAVVGVDDDTAIIAARIAERLSLKGNPGYAVEAARDKYTQRLRLRDAGVPIPTTP